MTSVHIPVKLNFCRDGLREAYAQVIAGTIPVAAVCGDGVGCCTCSAPHINLCLNHFTSMNIDLSDVEVLSLLASIQQSRTIPDTELRRLIQLKPQFQLYFLANQNNHALLAAEGQPWVKGLLNLDMALLNQHSADIPLELASCILAYQSFLAGCTVRTSCCDRVFCPMRAVKTAFKVASKLAPELVELIFSFV